MVPGPLVLVWASALALSVAALSWMSGLIVARAFHQRADQRRGRRRQEVVSGLLAILQGDQGASARLEPHRRRGRLLAETLLEVLGLVRGADRERVLASLRAFGLADILAENLDRGSAASRIVSMEALAALGGADAIGALRRMLVHGPPGLRLPALKALVDAGAEMSVGRLVDYAVSGHVPAGRLFTEIVRRAASERPGEAISALDRTDLDGPATIVLLSALGSAGDYQALPKLIEGTQDDRPEVRGAAVRSLGRLMHPAAEDAVARALRDPVWFVRCAAAEAAGASGFVRLEEELAHLLDDEAWWVRFRAAEALAAHGQPGLQRLQRLSREGGGHAQVAASLALAELGVG
jgi:HEAT repeat protein